MPEGSYYTPQPRRYTKYGSTGPRPHVWLTGPDPVRHEKYIAYIKHKSQANYRKEPHDLSFEDWLHFWTVENWSSRGRKNTAVVLTRIDKQGPWSKSNCKIQTRLEHLQEHGKANTGKRKPRKPKLI